MTNNDILRRIRYTFDFNNRKMLEIFALAGFDAKPSQIIAWLLKDGDPELVELNDNELAYFLNGFINEKRGKKEGEQPAAETTLNNNIIFKKIKNSTEFKRHRYSGNDEVGRLAYESSRIKRFLPQT
jgi:uncharacterized protein YehS (DUF1456 family)